MPKGLRGFQKNNSEGVKSRFKPGKDHINWGKKMPREHREKISNGIKKVKEKLWAWKGGITGLGVAIYNSMEYREWRNKIFQRDHYTCECGNFGEKLQAHHKKPFYIIFREFLKEYSQFSPIEDKEILIRLATTYKPFWDISNGKTLCKQCHQNTDGYLLKRKGCDSHS